MKLFYYTILLSAVCIFFSCKKKTTDITSNSQQSTDSSSSQSISGDSSSALAFPGAIGFGKSATGGRGDSIFHVTNLSDAGSGSFRDAVSKPNRFIIFDLSGVIVLKSKVAASSNLTIAGQSAPGKGIIVYGNGVSFANDSNCIVRYIRFRGSISMSSGTCTLGVNNCSNMIFDHVSVEWGRWDNLHIEDSKNVTFENCIIGEGINPQRFGALLEEPESLTVYHCLWIDNQSRNPKGKTLWMEYVNNIIYNWGSSGFIGGHSAAVHYELLLDNYFISGPNSTKGNFISNFASTDKVYQEGNYLDTNANGSLDRTLISNTSFSALGATMYEQKPTLNLSSSSIDSAYHNFAYIVTNAGDTYPARDSVDIRLIGYLQSLGKNGSIIKQESDVGGQQSISSVSGPIDSDHDGIPDTLESKYGLSATSYDAWKIAKNGYTYLENYLSSLLST